MAWSVPWPFDTSDYNNANVHVDTHAALDCDPHLLNVSLAEVCQGIAKL